MANDLKYWYINNASTAASTNTITLNTGSNPTHSSGFTGWQQWPIETEDVYDDFDMYVWETRRDNGIIEPKPEPIGKRNKAYMWSIQSAGRILWSGQLTVTNPKIHKQVYGWIDNDKETKDK